MIRYTVVDGRGILLQRTPVPLLAQPIRIAFDGLPVGCTTVELIRADGRTITSQLVGGAVSADGAFFAGAVTVTVTGAEPVPCEPLVGISGFLVPEDNDLPTRLAQAEQTITELTQRIAAMEATVHNHIDGYTAV